MNKEPIIEFKTQEELDACLAEWQERLFLSDWIIKANLNDISANAQECLAVNSYTPELKCATIRFARVDEDINERIMKYCAEKVLVHELLHCKMTLADGAPENIGGYFFNMGEHALLEQMAKSLIMAKYNLTFDWFKNF